VSFFSHDQVSRVAPFMRHLTEIDDANDF
jgi:hypothetical protein